MVILGTIGYILFFIYDINSIHWNNSIIKRFFFIGSIFILVGTIFEFVSNFKNIQFDLFHIIFIFLSILFFILLIYTLFFCFSFDETYIKQTNRKVYDKGMYGICRHPGIYWFFLLYVSLGMIIYPSSFIFKGILLSFYNLVYALFQDSYTFMHTFDDYDLYKKNVPFLPFIKL